MMCFEIPHFIFLFNFFTRKRIYMKKYYLVYDPIDNEGIFISTNLELVKRECEESGVYYVELPFYI